MKFFWKLRLIAFLVLAHVSPVRAEEIVVFAATSLKEPFEDLAKQLEKATPGLTVKLNFAGSQELRVQIEQGAPAAVFASADPRHLAALEKAGLLAGPTRIFARNEPVIVVPKGNPAGLKVFAELPKARRLVIGAPSVPIGRYTLTILDNAGGAFKQKVLDHVVSQELNVRQVLSRVVLGEADAAIVYRTDARSAGDKVEVVPIPAEVNVIASYPVAVVKGTSSPKAAEAFVALLLSADGQKRLAVAGFLAP